MSRFRSRVLLTAGVTSLLTSVAIADTTRATTTTEPESGAVEILPPDESFAGATLGEWAARWEEWTASLPEGFRCEDEQWGPMFFVPVSVGLLVGSVDCVVAEGKAIYVYVYGDFCASTVPPPYFGRNEEELRACVAALPPKPPQLGSAVNGHQVADLDSYRATSPMFNINVPPDNVSGNTSAVASLMVVHYGYIIAPPPPGDYAITVTNKNRAFNYTINLAVEAPQIIEPTGTETPQPSEAPDVTEPPSTT